MVKKGETVSNVLMIAQERSRKSERRLSEAEELKGKSEKQWSKSMDYLNKYRKEERATRAAFKVRVSAIGKAAAEKLWERSKTLLKKWTIKEGDNMMQLDTTKEQFMEAKSAEKKDNLALTNAKEGKSKADHKIAEAQQDCVSANNVQESMTAKFAHLKTKFAQMKLKYSAHNERKEKKTKAMGIWGKLKDATKKLKAEEKDEPLKPPGSPETGLPNLKKANLDDENAVLAKKVLADESASATSLAADILKDNQPGDFNSNMEVPASGKADESHPLYRYALERKEKAETITDPEDDPEGMTKKKELMQKSIHGMEHFKALKRVEENAANRDDEGNLVVPQGIDTLDKWDNRVGTEFRALGQPPASKPEETDAGEQVLLQENEQVIDVDAHVEDLVSEMLRNARLYMAAMRFQGRNLREL